MGRELGIIIIIENRKYDTVQVPVNSYSTLNPSSSFIAPVRRTYVPGTPVTFSSLVFHTVSQGFRDFPRLACRLEHACPTIAVEGTILVCNKPLLRKRRIIIFIRVKWCFSKHLENQVKALYSSNYTRVGTSYDRVNLERLDIPAHQQHSFLYSQQ